MIKYNQWEQTSRGSSEDNTVERPQPTPGSERRAHRRHDLEQQAISVERFDGRNGSTHMFGQLVDVSAGGIRIRTAGGSVQPDQQIRVRLELPDFAGICPFVDTRGAHPQPTRQWVGWMAVARVDPIGEDRYEVAGRLVDMEEMDRGMLGLYLSTQPLAA